MRRETKGGESGLQSRKGSVNGRRCRFQRTYMPRTAPIHPSRPSPRPSLFSAPRPSPPPRPNPRLVDLVDISAPLPLELPLLPLHPPSPHARSAAAPLRSFFILAYFHRLHAFFSSSHPIAIAYAHLQRLLGRERTRRGRQSRDGASSRAERRARGGEHREIKPRGNGPSGQERERNRGGDASTASRTKSWTVATRSGAAGARARPRERGESPRGGRARREEIAGDPHRFAASFRNLPLSSPFFRSPFPLLFALGRRSRASRLRW